MPKVTVVANRIDWENLHTQIEPVLKEIGCTNFQAREFYAWEIHDTVKFDFEDFPPESCRKLQKILENFQPTRIVTRTNQT